MSNRTPTQNLNQAANDLLNIKQAIIDKGVEIDYGIPTNLYAEKIESIETGITPSGELSITENGNYDVTEYASADIDVATGATLGSNIEVENEVINYGDTWINGELKLVIPEGITAISHGAFGDRCKLVTNLTLPDSLTSIGNNAFISCNALTSLTLPNSLTSIGYKAFQYCYTLTSLTLPDSLTFIGGYAFEGCYKLTTLTLPDSLTSIDNSTFGSCYTLASLILPDSLTSIGYGAFVHCYALTTLILPNSLTSIGNVAFKECDSLTTLDLTQFTYDPNDPTELPALGTNAFQANHRPENGLHVLFSDQNTLDAFAQDTNWGVLYAEENVTFEVVNND